MGRKRVDNYVLLPPRNRNSTRDKRDATLVVKAMQRNRLCGGKVLVFTEYTDPKSGDTKRVFFSDGISGSPTASLEYAKSVVDTDVTDRFTDYDFEPPKVSETETEMATYTGRNLRNTPSHRILARSCGTSQFPGGGVVKKRRSTTVTSSLRRVGEKGGQVELSVKRHRVDEVSILYESMDKLTQSMDPLRFLEKYLQDSEPEKELPETAAELPNIQPQPQPQLLPAPSALHRSEQPKTPQLQSQPALQPQPRVQRQPHLPENPFDDWQLDCGSSELPMLSLSSDDGVFAMPNLGDSLDNFVSLRNSFDDIDPLPYFTSLFPGEE